MSPLTQSPDPCCIDRGVRGIGTEDAGLVSRAPQENWKLATGNHAAARHRDTRQDRFCQQPTDESPGRSDDLPGLRRCAEAAPTLWRVDQYRGQPRIRVAATQREDRESSPTRRRAILAEWVELLSPGRRLYSGV